MRPLAPGHDGAMRGQCSALLLAAALSCGIARADEGADASVAADPDFAQAIAATSPERRPLNLLLTQAELRQLVSGYEDRTGEDLTAPVVDDDAVLVTAPGERLPMRDLSQDIPGGVFAPFWALAHPTQAWRILLPIPPKGPAPESERPAPDPR